MFFKDNKIKRFSRLFTLVMIITIFIPANFSLAIGELQEAPLNPEFIKYLEKQNNLDYGPSQIEPHGKGLIPEPVIIERNPHFRPEQLKGIEYPERFDLREEGRVTSVKNQEQNGSCWAFATYSSLESCLMPDEEWDFSENHLKNTHGFEWGHDAGGNRSMSTAYLSRWSGPVLEEDDPFNEGNGNSPEVFPIQKQVKNVLFLPDRSSSLDNDYIKWALMEYGAVQTSYFDKTQYLNKGTNSYFYNGGSITNHSVAIVGWDDNYSKGNFNIEPEGNGAFIVKNSWGENWGEEGYFYISYYDTKVGTNNAIYIGAEDVGYYDNIYQYDPLGSTSAVGFNTSGANKTNWFSNVFTSGNQDEELNAIAFYTKSENVDYEIWVDTDFENEDFSKLTKVDQGNVEIPGYHTIEFDPQEVKAGNTFAIAIKLTTPNSDYPIPLESPVEGFANATANENESYISVDGVNWIELTTYESRGKRPYKDSNVNLKAFTRDVSLSVEGISLNKSELFLKPNQEETLVASILPENAGNKDVIWESSNDKVAKVDSEGRVTAKEEGETIITATTVDGEYSSFCDVIVSKDPIIIENIELDNNVVDISLKIMESEDLEGVLIVQAFDQDNRVLKLKSSNIDKLETDYKFDFEDTTKPINSVKIYVWDNLNNMKPLVGVKEL